MQYIRLYLSISLYNIIMLLKFESDNEIKCIQHKLSAIHIVAHWHDT